MELIVNERVEISVKVIKGNSGRLFFRINDGDLVAYEHDADGRNLRMMIDEVVESEVSALVETVFDMTVGVDL